MEVNGLSILIDDEDGGLTCTALPQVGDEIKSVTRGSSISGRVVSIDDGDYTIQGCAAGAQSSILGGSSCHATWQLLGIDRVEGTFGVHSTLGAYIRRRDSYREKFYLYPEAEEDEAAVPQLTPLGQKMADLLLTERENVWDLVRACDLTYPAAVVPAGVGNWRQAREVVGDDSPIGDGSRRLDLLTSPAWRSYLKAVAAGRPQAEINSAMVCVKARWEGKTPSDYMFG